MEQSALPNRGVGPRHSILDLAPLELECMRVLWPLGEGTVRDIYRQLAAARPRAYTTIMTIMDRLARKGIVRRRKVGRAYRYQANLSAAEARTSAVEKIVTAFFDGSAEALAVHLVALSGTARSFELSPARPEPRRSETRPEPPELSRRAAVDGTGTACGQSVTRRLDETLP
jgi:predicted transcriptional regulator